MSAEPTTSRTISVDVNGDVYERDVDARRLLVHFIRDELELTGTHIGCDTGNCGACTVHLERHGAARHRLGHYFLLPAACSTARAAETSAR